MPGFNRKRMLDLFAGRFIQEKASVVLLVAPGVGKSHLAVALGREACRLGHRVKLFFTVCSGSSASVTSR